MGAIEVTVPTASRRPRGNGLPPAVPALVQVALVAALFVVWDLAVRVFNPRPDLVPPPQRVIEAAWADRERIWIHAQPTLIETFAGLGVAFAVAVIVATVLDAFPSVSGAVLNLFVGAQAIPIVAIAPLMVIWFGFGMLPKIILIVVATFFPLTISILEGLRSSDRESSRLLTSMGASRAQIYLYLKVPSSVPFVMTGLRVVVSYAITAAIFAEYVGSERGLGIYLQMAKNSLRTDLVFAVVILVVAVSVALFMLTHLLERLLAPWERHRRTRP